MKSLDAAGANNTPEVHLLIRMDKQIAGIDGDYQLLARARGCFVGYFTDIRWISGSCFPPYTKKAGTYK